MLGATWELRQLTESLCQAAGFAPKVAFEGDDVAMVTGFVAAGLGVAIVPSMGLAPQAHPRSDGPTLVAISDPGAVRDIGMAWSRERRLLPSAALFREFVLAADLSGFSLGT
jgi:LysR family transcriptional activator of glutamate synthase operon